MVCGFIYSVDEVCWPFVRVDGVVRRSWGPAVGRCLELLWGDPVVACKMMRWVDVLGRCAQGLVHAAWPLCIGVLGQRMVGR